MPKLPVKLGTAPSGLAALVFVLTCGMGVATAFLLVSPRWFVLDLDGLELTRGLFQECSSSDGSCIELEFFDVASSKCHRTAVAIKRAYNVCRAFTVLAGCFVVACGTATITACQYSRSNGRTIPIFGALAVLFYFMDTVAYAVIHNNWMYCGNECDYRAEVYPFATCKTKYDAGFWVLVAMLFASVITLGLGIFIMLRLAPRKATAAEKAAAGGGAAATGEVEEYPAPWHLADDWYWDEDAGYYYSDQVQLYFDGESGMVYDEPTDTWYYPPPPTQ